VAPAAPVQSKPEKVKKGFMGKLKGKDKAVSSTTPKPSPQMRSVSETMPIHDGFSLGSSAGPRKPLNETTFAAINDDDTGKRGGLKRTRSLFNMKNASTDNISIASAASSASMMIRKIGSFGKLASRNR